MFTIIGGTFQPIWPNYHAVPRKISVANPVFGPSVPENREDSHQGQRPDLEPPEQARIARAGRQKDRERPRIGARSEEATSELQSIMRISYDVFCLHTKQKNTTDNNNNHILYR